MFHVKHRGGEMGGQSFLRKNVSRETSGAAGPQHAILQNNPMDQKIDLVFQGVDLAHFWALRTPGERANTASEAGFEQPEQSCVETVEIAVDVISAVGEGDGGAVDVDRLPDAAVGEEGPHRQVQ